MTYQVFEEIPSVAEYLALRKAVQFSSKSLEGAAIGLKNSCYCVCLRDSKGKLIAMGRVIGDGGTVFQVVDIMTQPEAQGQGHGKKILQKIGDYLKTVDSKAYINLIATAAGQKLYESVGFVGVAPSVAMKYTR